MTPLNEPLRSSVVSALGLRRDRVVEVRRGDGDVVDAFALLGEEAREDALLVERLDQLPHHPADHGGGGDAWSAFDRLAVMRAGPVAFSG